MIGRITGFTRPSVCPFVRLRVSISNIKSRKIIICVNVYFSRKIFSSKIKLIKGQNSKKMTHNSRTNGLLLL